MPMNELQWGLMGAGAAAVVGIMAYNKWQDRRLHRRYQESFKTEQADALLEPGNAAERVEPSLTGETPPPEEHKLPDFQVPDTQALSRRPPPGQLPGVDTRVDWVARIESIEGLVPARIGAALRQELAELKLNVRLFAFSDVTNRWDPIPPAGQGDDHAPRCHHFAIALQLADRRGPVGELELSNFCHAVQLVADDCRSIPTFPGRIEALERAVALDAFCADMDIQIAVNVIATGDPFSGRRLEELARSAGMVFSNGCFEARNAEGAVEFALYGYGEVPLPKDGLHDFTADGVSLVLDVPRAPAGEEPFNRMLAFAQQLAGNLRGVVVDDNRHPFSDRAASRVRAQVADIQSIMQESGVPAGGVLALRLFSH